MPYWSIYCLYCHGYIADALLECLPVAKRSSAAYRFLFHARSGAALACPYCNSLIGFDHSGQPQAPHSGWTVFRYGQAELEVGVSRHQAVDLPADVSAVVRRLRARHPASEQRIH